MEFGGYSRVYGLEFGGYSRVYGLEFGVIIGLMVWSLGLF